MSNIYLNTEQKSMPPTDNQIEGCHGHFVSINAGGIGHSYGDSVKRLCDAVSNTTKSSTNNKIYKNEKHYN